MPQLDWGVAQVADIAQLPQAIKGLTDGQGWQVYTIFPFQNALKMPIIALIVNRLHVDEPTGDPNATV